MQKNKFSLCDMMPNTWLNKLRDMAKSRRLRIGSANKASQKDDMIFCKSPELQISSPFQPNLQNYVPNRSSQYLPTNERLDVSCDRHFPTRPTKLKPRSKPTSPVSIHQKCQQDIVFEIGGSRSPEVKLRPILTKPRTRSRANKTKVKVRPIISPRCNSRAKQRRWMLESYLVVKHSSDPEKDFMESMLEMIVEKNIVKLKDLEELLACYLSLNSREYQDVIVKVFEKIWFVFFEANYI